MVAGRDPQLAARALDGLSKYGRTPRNAASRDRPIAVKMGAATLRDCGGDGPPAVLIPSLINPPDVLDLDKDVSLAAAVAAIGRRALLLDWGPAAQRCNLDLGGHVEHLLVPLLRQLPEPPALIGYCLGGTMAVAAANLVEVERVATLAAPWTFAAYPAEARQALAALWKNAERAARELHALPMEVLQSAFWSLDPERTVAKFARFAEVPPGDPAARRFVTLEDWANTGEPLPFPAARELIEDLFGCDLPGRGEWHIDGNCVSDTLACPLLNVTASSDRITPASTAPAGETVQVESGHVGMVVGSARSRLHEALAKFLSSCR